MHGAVTFSTHVSFFTPFGGPALLQVTAQNPPSKDMLIAVEMYKEDYKHACALTGTPVCK